MKKAAVLSVLLLVAGACSSKVAPSASPSASPVPPSASPSAAEPLPSPSASAAPMVQPSPIHSVPAGAGGYKLVDPADAAVHLYQAWQRGDRASAARYAEKKAVDTLFARPYTGPELQFMGCEHQVDHYLCSYYYVGGAMIFRVEGGVSAGYFVSDVSSIAD